VARPIAERRAGLNHPMIPITYPFDFAQGRLFSQSARKGWGTRPFSDSALGAAFRLRQL